MNFLFPDAEKQFLLIPMLTTFFVLLIKAQKYEVAEVALSILFILFLYTFGENLEILAYLYWFALVIMGIALKSQKKNSEQRETLPVSNLERV